MTSADLREKYLKYFEKLGHKIIDPVPLVLEDDPTTLFTSAGMQPLVPYLKGKEHPEGKRLVNSQPCFRSQDIEEVGDNCHTTFFEMLGNWSLGDYFKKEQLEWCWKFLTEELGLDKGRLHVSVFEGTDGVLRDTETEKVWKSLGIAEDHIHYYGTKKNWWSVSGPPENMKPGEIGGPDAEVFFDFGEELGLHKQWIDKVTPCHPNCDCGRFLEIGNSVFIQYEKQGDGSLKELSQKNVDFGGGLERLLAAVNNDPDIFKTDLYKQLIEDIERQTGKSYENEEFQPAIRIIADHVRAAAHLIASSVVPSNKLQGYVLRRLLRRAAVKLRQLKPDIYLPGAMLGLAWSVEPLPIDTENEKQLASYEDGFEAEMKRFEKTIERGIKEIEKIEKIDGKIAFDLYQSYGYPLEITEELFREKGQEINHSQFEEEFEKHRELSRTSSAGVFRGGLATMGEIETKYHTATHLLQAALRRVLGDHVKQMGSNITSERLRFDFSHPQALIKEEIVQAEEQINRVIDEDLPVTRKVMSKDKAIKEGAMAFFKEKYPDEVSVYTICDPNGEPFSKELCGGPHVGHTGEIGRVTITKEESAGSGIRRIYAKID